MDQVRRLGKTIGLARVSPDGRTWWLSTRSAGIVHAYRATIAAALALHFGKAIFKVAPWLGDGRLVSPAALASVVRHPMFHGIGSLPPPAFAFAAGSALALVVSMGAIPRVAGVTLYVLSVVTYSAILPFANAEDYFAILASFTLCVLPVRSAASRSFESRRNDEGRLPAASVSLILGCVLFVYLAGAPSLVGALGPREASVVGNGFRFVAIALIAPVEAAQFLAVAMQLALHAYLLVKTQCLVANIVLAGTAIFFVGERAPERGPRFLIDGSTVAVAMSVVVAALGVAQAWLAPQRIDGPLRLAIDTGFIPSHGAFAEGSDSSISIWTDRDGKVTSRSFDTGDSRTRILASRLAGASRDGLLAHDLAFAVAKRFCSEPGREGETGHIERERETSHLLDFKCRTAANPTAIR